MSVNLNVSAMKYKDPSTGEYKNVVGALGDSYAEDMIAPKYEDLTFPVTEGQLCIHNNSLYKSKQDISASESWTEAHWEATTIDEGFREANEGITDLKSHLDIEDDKVNAVDKEVTNTITKINTVPCNQNVSVSRDDSWRPIDIPNGSKYQLLISSDAVASTARISYYLSTDNGTTWDSPLSLVNGQISDVLTSSKNYNAMALYAADTIVISTGKIITKVIVGDKSNSLQNQINNLKAIVDANDSKCDIDSKWLFDIYKSETNNLLDVSTFIDGYYIARNTPYIAKANGARMSRFVYVENLQGQSITVSGNTEIMEILFLSDAKLDNTANLSEYNLNSSSRTITVPSNSKYALVSFRTPSNDNTIIHDYSNMKVSKGSEVTSDVFVAKYIGNPLLNSIYIPDAVNDYETVKAISEFAPISVGAPSGITFDRQYERANFVFFSDSHIDMPSNGASYSQENVNNTIKFINTSNVPFDAVIHTGDVITKAGVRTQAEWIGFMQPFFDQLKSSNKPVVFSIGNHDTNDWSNTPANAMDDTSWGTAWLDWAETNMGIIRQTKQNGHKSTWHYKDIEDKKIRIISLDVQNTDKTVTDGSGHVLYYGSVAWYISQEQMNWVIGTALNFNDKDDKGWGVIVALHQIMNKNDSYYATSVSPEYESAIPKLIQVLKAFNTQGTYSSTYTFPTDSFYDLDINADFSRYANETNKPFVICMLTGHEHFDRVKTVEGINMLWVTNGSCTSEYSDSRLARIAKTPTQNAFNLISVDTEERKLRVIRFGAGNNCFGEKPYMFMPDGISF